MLRILGRGVAIVPDVVVSRVDGPAAERGPLDFEGGPVVPGHVRGGAVGDGVPGLAGAGPAAEGHFPVVVAEDHVEVAGEVQGLHLVGDELAESLYHLTLLISLTNSSLC